VAALGLGLYSRAALALVARARDVLGRVGARVYLAAHAKVLAALFPVGGVDLDPALRLGDERELAAGTHDGAHADEGSFLGMFLP